MKINFSQTLLDARKTPIYFSESEQSEGKPATLAAVAMNALMATYKDELELSGEQKIKRFDLAERIFMNSECDLTAQEVVELKTLINKFYGTIVAAPALKMIKAAE